MFANESGKTDAEACRVVVGGFLDRIYRIDKIEFVDQGPDAGGILGKAKLWGTTSVNTRRR